MSALGRKLRQCEGGILLYWCPGCDHAHGVWTTQPNPYSGSTWSWNGNIDRPTFSPSVHCFSESGGQRRTCCHHFVRDGRIDFCGDSPHALRGQSVELPNWPLSDDETDAHLAAASMVAVGVVAHGDLR